MLLAEMVWITADQSQNMIDFSPVCMLTMWLLRTSYIATIQYDTVVILLYSEWPRKQSKHSRMSEPYKNSKLLRPIKISEAAYLLRYCCSGAKKKCLTLSHGPKTPLLACVFYEVLICTWFWLYVNRYTCFGDLTQIKYVMYAFTQAIFSGGGVAVCTRQD